MIMITEQAYIKEGVLPFAWDNLRLENKDDIQQWLRLINGERDHFFKPPQDINGVAEFMKVARIRVLKQGGVLVATTALQFEQSDNPWVCLDELRYGVVRPDMRGHGLGREIIQEGVRMSERPWSLGVGVYTQEPGADVIERLLVDEGFGPDIIDISSYGYSNDEIHYYLYEQGQKIQG